MKMKIEIPIIELFELPEVKKAIKDKCESHLVPKGFVLWDVDIKLIGSESTLVITCDVGRKEG